MKTMIIILTLIFGTQVMAQDKPSLVPKKNQIKTYRKPAQKKVEPPAEIIPTEELLLSFTTNYYVGGIYFGGEKVPADFTYVGADLILSNSMNTDFGISGGYLFNKSAVTVYNGNIYYGYKHKFNAKTTVRLGPQVGFSIYNEKTTIQQVSAFGLHLGAKIQVDYKLNSGLFLGAGLNWRHDMFASSFWGKDPYSDVVLDFVGPQITVGWSF